MSVELGVAQEQKSQTMGWEEGVVSVRGVDLSETGVTSGTMGEEKIPSKINRALFSAQPLKKMSCFLKTSFC